jgi:phospholipid-translocating ATPase
VVLICFFITVAGWWAWSAFLSGVYAPAPTPYAVRDGFRDTFGRDPVWWLTLVAVLAVFAVAEVAAKVVRRNLVVAGMWKWPPWKRRELSGRMEEWDVELWQEMEQDPSIRAQLARMCRAEEEVVGVERLSQQHHRTVDGNQER